VKIVRCNLIILSALKDNSISRKHINRANPYILHNVTALPFFPFLFLFCFPPLREKHRLMVSAGVFASDSYVEQVDRFHESWNESYAIRRHNNRLNFL
jgi:hypothetical protein